MILIENDTKKELAYDEYVNMRNNNKYLTSVTVLDDSQPISEQFIIMKKLKTNYNFVEALLIRFNPSKYPKDGKHSRSRIRKKFR